MKLSSLISLENTIQLNNKIPKPKRQDNNVNIRPISALLVNRNKSKSK